MRSFDGVLLVLFGTAWFCAMSLMIKAMGPGMPVHWTAFVRSVVMIPAIWLVARQRGVTLSSANKTPLILRGVWGSAAMFLAFWALPRAPIANVMLLTHASPLYAAVLGVMFMNEKLDKAAMASIAVAVAGVVVTLRPGASDFSLPLYAALLSGLLSSLAFVAIKTLTATEPSLRIIFWYGVMASAVFAPGALLSGYWPSPKEWAVLSLVGLTGAVGQVFLTVGIKRAPVSKASFGALFLIVLNTAGGWFFFGERPDAMTWLGCLLVTAGILGLTEAGRKKLLVAVPD